MTPREDGMKVAVIGSGAMGTIFGLAMARSGDDGLFYDVRPDLIAAIEQDGLRLEGVLGNFHSRLRATLKPEQLGAVDCALVMVDANATPQAAKVVASCLSNQGFALSLHPEGRLTHRGDEKQSRNGPTQSAKKVTGPLPSHDFA
jgi:2-dehydropantoate 2-reductase